MTASRVRPEGIFTTARVEEGRLVRRALHRARLLHDARLLAAHGRALVEDNRIEASVDALLLEADRQAAALGAGMARLLLVVDGAHVTSHVEIGPARRKPWVPGDPPLRLVTRPDPRPADEPFVKSLDRASFAPLDDEARALGVDGVLLEGPEGIREGTWFHVALRVGGVWRLPPVGEGVLYGSTRAAFLEALARRRELFEEAPVPPALLTQSEGMVALSSLLGMAPVSRVDEAHLPLLLPFPL